LCGSGWIDGVTIDVAVTVRYWAGAKRAAGRPDEQLAAPTLAALLDQLRQRPALAPVLASASYLVDGQAADPTATLSAGAVVDVLPPFAGG
jgi:molybdopterin converting factor small subunit